MNPTDSQPPPASAEPTVPTPKVRWLIFFPLLLVPAVLAYIGAAAKSEGFAIAAPLIGGAISGLVCGIQLARRLGRTPAAKVLLSLLFFGLLGSLSFALGFAGCMAGGFKMDFR